MTAMTTSLTNIQNRPFWREQLAMAAILLACVLALVFVFSRLIRLQEVWSG